MKNKSLTSKNKFRLWINVVSVAVPVVVALLFKVRLPNVEALTFLPPIYAAVNGITAILLILALIAIKNKKNGIAPKRQRKQIQSTPWHPWHENGTENIRRTPLAGVASV